MPLELKSILTTIAQIRVPSLSSIVMVAIAGSSMTLGGLKTGSVNIKVNVSLFSHTLSSIMVIVSQCRRSVGGGMNDGRVNSTLTAEV